SAIVPTSSIQGCLNRGLRCVLPRSFGRNGHHCIELTIQKRQRFDDALSERNFSASLVGFPTCPGKHLWRCVDSVDGARRSDPPFGGDGECASPAAYVQDRLTGF